MTDDNLIRRGDALDVAPRCGVCGWHEAIAALDVQPAPDVAALVAALREARNAAHEVAHSEFDGVWNDQDFADLTPLADAALAAWEARK
jgi:hypothetical protein